MRKSCDEVTAFGDVPYVRPSIAAQDMPRPSSPIRHDCSDCTKHSLETVIFSVFANRDRNVFGNARLVSSASPLSTFVRFRSVELNKSAR